MKLKSLLYFIPTLLIAAVIIVSFQSSDEAVYSPREANNGLSKSAQGAIDYYQMVNADPATGKINPDDVLALKNAMDRLPQNNSRGPEDLNFVEMGPDNIAGRIRGIESDPANPERMWTGGVSGGLFRTDDGGLSWEFMEGFNENMMVSSICLLGNGTLYVGTGNINELSNGEGSSGFLGNGLFKSTDQGETFELVSDFEPGTLNSSDDWSRVNRMERNPLNPNSLWIAFGGGVREYIDGNDDLEPRADGLPSGSASGTDIDISADGQTVVCVISDNVFISRDAGQTFEDVSGGNAELPTSGVGRTEFALCPNDPNYMYAFMSTSAATGSNGYLHSVWASEDGGENFDQIAFNSNNGTLTFSPCISANGQCWYDQDISVNPENCEEIFLGGVRVYKWEKSNSGPIFGQWDQAAFQTQGIPGQYVHADIHYFHWTSDNTLYLGTDGGVFVSPDQGLQFFAANRFLNITQLYDMDFGPQGQVLGGSQDNGCMYIDFLGNTLQEARDIPGSGDGFDVEHSQLNSDVMFTSSQNSVVLRSNDGGNNTSVISPYANGPFYTVQEYWETDEDFDSPQTVQFVNFTTDTIFANEEINYASQSLGLPLTFETPNTVFPGDTIELPDPVSTWYATSSSGSNPLSISRNAANFNSTDFDWILPFNAIGGTITKMKFSPDGNHLYVGTSAGRLTRISGLANVYSPEEADYTFRPANNETVINVATNDTIEGNLNSVDFSAASYTFLDGTPVTYKVNVAQIKSTNSNAVTGIAIDPNDNERVAISIGGYLTSTSHVMLSESGQSTLSDDTFQPIWNEPGGINGIERMPVYSVSFDMDNPGRIIAGTEYGIFVSENDGGTWEECNNTGLPGGMGRVPVYELLQQTLPPSEGVWNTGQIYAGTHGRGFWTSGDFVVSVDDIVEEEVALVDGLTIYPNPVNDNANIRFELSERNDVELRIYDIKGNLIFSQSKLNMSSGQRTMEFNVADFASGIYVVNLRVKDQVQFGKFVKQ